MKKFKMAIVFFTVLLAGIFLMSCPEDTSDEGKPSKLAGKLLILQAYGSADDAAGATHSFVELYNTTKEAINLEGISLFCADGVRGLGVTEDWEWEKIELSGIIPAEGSFLILGPNEGSTVARYKIDEKHGANYGDINDLNFKLSNRSFKVALIEGSANLSMQNPFDVDGAGKKASGYIDMVGAANDPTHSNPDNIFGYETAPTRNSKSEAARRKNLTDTDDNSVDFIAARYALGGMTNDELEVRYPRNSSAGKWDPFAEPVPPPPPPPGTEMLMILQANTFGNNNGISNGAPTGGGFARSLVELYNNTNSAINLTTGNYYLHIGNATEWTNVIKLEGTIPALSSFLIVSNTEPATTGGTGNSNATPRATLPAANQSADFILVNDDFVVAILTNQSSTLTGNPFINNSLAADYIDMLGCRNAVGFETEAATTSRPQGPRRILLDDTDNNKTDFAQADFRGRINTNGVNDDQLFKIWPRNSAAGAWNPITGLPAVHPTVVPVTP